MESFENGHLKFGSWGTFSQIPVVNYNTVKMYNT